MPVRVDREADVLYIYLADTSVSESAEVAEGIIADYDADARVVGLEIFDASKRKNTPLSGVMQSLDEAKAGQKNLTKQQHYVWAFYLRAWENNDGKINCYWLQNKRFGTPKPDGVAKESFFYRSHRLSAEDMKYLDWLVIQASIPGLEAMNRSTINFFTEIYDVEHLLKELDVGSEGREVFSEHIRFAEKMFGEKYHNSIEQKAEPILRQLRLGDAESLTEEEKYQTFVFYLSQQLFRTSKMRSVIFDAFSQRPSGSHDPRRTGPIEQQIYANNIAASIISETGRYKFKVLHNKSNLPFITGDQPVVNLHGHQISDLQLYYPVSPSIAILLDAENSHNRTVGKLEVELLNYRIFEASYRQVFADNKNYLKDIVNAGKIEF